MQIETANIAFVTSRRYCDIGENIPKRHYSTSLQLSRGNGEEQIGYSSVMLGSRFISGF